MWFCELGWVILRGGADTQWLTFWAYCAFDFCALSLCFWLLCIEFAFAYYAFDKDIPVLFIKSLIYAAKTKTGLEITVLVDFIYSYIFLHKKTVNIHPEYVSNYQFHWHFVRRVCRVRKIKTFRIKTKAQTDYMQRS